MVAEECKKCEYFSRKDKLGEYGYCEFYEDVVNLDYNDEFGCEKFYEK